MSDYQQAIEALTKAYKLADFEVLVNIKNQIYRDFGTALADNIDAIAHERRRHV